MSSAQLSSTADDAALPSGPCILNLSRLKQDETVRTAPHLRLDVALPVDQPAEVLAPYLNRLSLVAVNFPTFRDGRGFTQARSLRERLAFSAEIRATGNILPDQYVFLLRCGITTVETQDGADPAAWQKAADRFCFAYQPSVVKEPVLSGLRRTTWRAAEYLIAVDRKIGSDPATTQNNVSNPNTLFSGANGPAT